MDGHSPRLAGCIVLQAGDLVCARLDSHVHHLLPEFSHQFIPSIPGNRSTIVDRQVSVDDTSVPAVLRPEDLGTSVPN